MNTDRVSSGVCKKWNQERIRSLLQESPLVVATQQLTCYLVQPSSATSSLQNYSADVYAYTQGETYTHIHEDTNTKMQICVQYVYTYIQTVCAYTSAETQSTKYHNEARQPICRWLQGQDEGSSHRIALTTTSGTELEIRAYFLSSLGTSGVGLWRGVQCKTNLKGLGYSLGFNPISTTACVALWP